MNNDAVHRLPGLNIHIKAENQRAEGIPIGQADFGPNVEGDRIRGVVRQEGGEFETPPAGRDLHWRARRLKLYPQRRRLQRGKAVVVDVAVCRGGGVVIADRAVPLRAEDEGMEQPGGFQQYSGLPETGTVSGVVKPSHHPGVGIIGENDVAGSVILHCQLGMHTLNGERNPYRCQPEAHPHRLGSEVYPGITLEHIAGIGEESHKQVVIGVPLQGGQSAAPVRDEDVVDTPVPSAVLAILDDDKVLPGVEDDHRRASGFYAEFEVGIGQQVPEL